MMNRPKAISEEPEVKTQEIESDGGCRHYWLIESANGPTSTGFCKYCGVERVFHNSPPEYAFSKRQVDKSVTPVTPPRKVNAERKSPETVSVKN